MSGKLLNIIIISIALNNIVSPALARHVIIKSGEQH